MSKKARRRLYIEPRVQGALLRRIVLYWTSCLLFLTIPQIIGRWIVVPGPSLLEHTADVFASVWPVLLAALLMLPLLLYDVLKLSNRFAGPLYRLRQELQRLAKDEDIAPVRLRDADFLHDVAEELNAVAAKLRQLRSGPAATPEGTVREEPLAASEVSAIQM